MKSGTDKRTGGYWKSKKQLYKKLTEGNIEDCVKIYEDYVKIFNASDFFDKILKPVMYDIGEHWASHKISIATVTNMLSKTDRMNADKARWRTARSAFR